MYTVVAVTHLGWKDLRGKAMGLLQVLLVPRPTAQRLFLFIIWVCFCFCFCFCLSLMANTLTQNIMLILQFLGYQPQI